MSRQKLSLTFISQKFRESNGFTKRITKELFSRNIFTVREFLAFAHSPTEWKNEKFPATQIFFRQINLQQSSLVKR